MSLASRYPRLSGMGWHPGAGVGANLDGESMSQGFEKAL